MTDRNLTIIVKLFSLDILPSSTRGGQAGGKKEENRSNLRLFTKHEGQTRSWHPSNILGEKMNQS